MFKFPGPLLSYSGTGCGLAHNPFFASLASFSKPSKTVSPSIYLRYYQPQPSFTSVWLRMTHMSSLTGMEKGKLEKLFDKGSGYVLNFSDSTIAQFFADTLDVDIHAEKYRSTGTSKAKKLQEFWRLEPDHLVGESISALIQHIEENPPYDASSEEKKRLFDPCKAIATRLLSGKVNLDHLKETAATFDARHLAEQIRCMEQSV